MYKEKIAYINPNRGQAELFVAQLNDRFEILYFDSVIRFVAWLKHGNLVESPCKLILSVSQLEAAGGIQLLDIIKSLDFVDIPFVIISDSFTYSDKKLAVSHGVTDLFLLSDLKQNDFISHLTDLVNNPPQKRLKTVAKTEHSLTNTKYKTPFFKRCFDLFFAGFALLFLSPLLLLIALIIKLDSKGPVFYISKRVGAGFQVFDFYKFRSMGANADKKLRELSHLNQYGNQENTDDLYQPTELFERCEDCREKNLDCKVKLYLDGRSVCETLYLRNKNTGKTSTFVKLKDDPRVTKFGNFIRKTSIDELPQLINVIKGDMSLVGNRPLPLYEAEQLTTDALSMRFMAPAGITGLWQVSRRGKKEMSQAERLKLDNYYAKHYSMKHDFVIILKTIPALLQKENV